MTIVLLLGLVVVVAVLELVPARKLRRRSAPAGFPGAARRRRPADDDREARERALASGVLAGKTDPADYREAMAALAADDSPGSGDVAMLVWLERTPPEGDPRDLLRRLGTALPGIPSTTVCSAVALARSGAKTDELIRTLHLTRVQARTIISAVNAG
ncbi:hypothetical protein QRX60_41720 [Amycolatopsis mongoliensis]|uniref:Uncharacterized protein n=1 Tax=Amycolatopsis mongoliensis TaxID=715475 RepID=A0A9Y2NI94_9PSEU|nr:hypothetical protein [Amycolatopsis sp. 4-36]WIY00513.1 hypothetical protein QRX60_41720 [Amycolatopsis sp. 4-36]